jgi:NAD+ kinase
VNLALVANPSKESILDVLARLRAHVPDTGHRLLLWNPVVEQLRRRADFDRQLEGYEFVDDIHDGEVVLALGGDGTLLTAVRLLGDDLRPLLGINLGSLGFLTDTPEERVEEAVRRVLEGRYRCDTRMLLESVFQPREGPEVRMRGLNDVVVHDPSARVLEVSMRASSVDLGTTLADGIILATPSGSTAYSLSAGGPIVSPRLRALIMTPISAHTLSVRPLVVDAEEGIEIRLLSSSSPQAEITVDGHSCCAMHEGDILRIRAAARDLQLVRTQDHHFYNMLRTKLGWGQGRHGSGT